MPTEFTTDDLLKRLGPEKCQTTSDHEASIGAHVVRCPGLRLVAVGGEQDEKRQINALLDGLHWDRQFHTKGLLRFVLGSGKHTTNVRPALATLLSALDPREQGRIQVEIDFEPISLIPPDFSNSGTRWLSDIRQRTNARPPALAESVSRDVADPSFRWYRTVTSTFWSGRVEGLEVCRIRPPYTHGSLSIGSTGKSGAVSSARRRFLELSGGRQEILFDENGRRAAVELIRQLVQDRSEGCLAKVKPEHLLESRVLRSAVAVSLADIGPLKPVVTDTPFQFPTLWSTAGSPKYVDLLMRAGAVPWLVELKAPSGGQGQYYRHAVGQAVLYRTFIQQAKLLHPWFQDQGLDPTQCRAAVVFPELRGSTNEKRRLMDDLDWLAKLFDVPIIQLAVPAGTPA